MSEIATESKLTAKQLKALAVYFETGDVSQATKEAGVARSTFYRWMSDSPAFQERIRETALQALEVMSINLVGLGQKATDFLRDVFENPKATVAQKLRATEIIINGLLKVRELVTLEERVQAIEQAQERKGYYG